ncbi:MAG TPA: SOS response-associated peptidase [Candidatus Limnocylindria bacterium]|nr:SOS response-associated peptidase [Candidatus Limnocylindria bacterium]
MCGRFSQAESSRRLAAVFGADPDPDLPAGGYNVAPTDPIRAVLVTDGRRRLTTVRWGFLPSWAGKDGRRTPGWINARAETALDSSLFGSALRGRRCVIPADAFYEWDRRVEPRQAYAIGPVDDEGVLAFAGIWAPPREAGERPSAAILTAGPNAVVASIHDRMPVILPAALVDTWLDPAAPLEEIVPLLGAADDDAVRAWPVSPAVNRVGTDGPDLLRPVEPPATLGLV